ncbi:MAG: SDR family oxidoreductase [Myxococcales bacterium FL481]|nr:MAG: SDR family oxidoreductase [Myxococcales bacterium FL481]
MSLLANKITLITGGTTGIGLATAQRYAAEGATVIATGRNPETLAAARQQLGERADVIASDAAREEDINELIETVRAKHGRIDVLFLNAGIATFAPMVDAPVDAFDRMWQVNVRGPWLTLRKAIPLLSEGASVIFNTSVVNQKGVPGSTGYAATKGALRSIVRAAASELAGNKIRVNAIAPGPIETPIYGKLGMPADAVDTMAQGFVAQVPLSRFGAASEVAGVATFLASADSSYITGSELAVDGGYSQV